MTVAHYSVDDHFQGKDPHVRLIYGRLLAQLRDLGPIDEQPKKTSINLARAVGFAGVQTRRNYLLLNIRSAQPIESPRVLKAEQVSKNRYHQEVKLAAVDDIDDELLGWMRDAYKLSA